MCPPTRRSSGSPAVVIALWLLVGCGTTGSKEQLVFPLEMEPRPGVVLNLMPFTNSRGTPIATDPEAGPVSKPISSSTGSIPQLRFTREDYSYIRRSILATLRAWGYYAEVRDIEPGAESGAGEKLTLRFDRVFGWRTPTSYRVELGVGARLGGEAGSSLGTTGISVLGTSNTSLVVANRMAVGKLIAELGSFLDRASTRTWDRQ